MTQPHHHTDESTRLETHPTTAIVFAKLAATVVVGGILAAYLYTVKQAFGTEGFGSVAGTVVLLVTAVGVVHFLTQILVRYRTTYAVTDRSIRREFHLAFRRVEREVPISMLRGVRLDQGRLQNRLGFGDVEFLTAGSGRSIGHVTFEDVEDPGEVRDLVRSLHLAVERGGEDPVEQPSGGRQGQRRPPQTEPATVQQSPGRRQRTPDGPASDPQAGHSDPQAGHSAPRQSENAPQSRPPESQE